MRAFNHDENYMHNVVTGVFQTFFLLFLTVFASLERWVCVQESPAGQGEGVAEEGEGEGRKETHLFAQVN